MTSAPAWTVPDSTTPFAASSWLTMLLPSTGEMVGAPNGCWILTASCDEGPLLPTASVKAAVMVVTAPGLDTGGSSPAANCTDHWPLPSTVAACDADPHPTRTLLPASPCPFTATPFARSATVTTL